MSAGQQNFLNDMGVLPSELEGLTYSQASRLIDEHKPAFLAAKHDNRKPPTGKQRAKALEKGLDISHIQTKEDCCKYFDQHFSDADSIPASEAQLACIRKRGQYTMAQASSIIAAGVEQLKGKATVKQLALLGKLNPYIPKEIIDKLTFAQASAMIAALFAKRMSGGFKSNAKNSERKKDDGDDSHDPDAKGGSERRGPRSGGAYGTE